MQTAKWLGVVFIAMISGGAWAAPGVGKPSDATDIVSAQIGVTRDTLQTYVREVQSGGKDNFEHADFKTKATRFLAQADEGLRAFEEALRNKLLAGLKIGISRYNSIHASKAYSETEKTALMSQTYKMLESWRESFVRQYIIEVQNLLKLSGAAPIEYFMRTIESNRYTTMAKLDLHTIDWDFNWTSEIFYTETGSELPRHETQMQFAREIYSKYLYPKLLRSCVSQGCITLSTVLLSNYIQLIESNFLKDLKVELADGKSLTIPLSKHIEQNTLFLLLALANSSLPPQADELPFDCRDLVSAAKQRRLQLINKLIDTLSMNDGCDKRRPDLASHFREIAALPELRGLPAMLTNDELAYVLYKSKKHGLSGESNNEKCLFSALKEAIPSAPVLGRKGS